MLQFPSELNKSSGVFESLLSAGIFFLPNLLIFFPAIREAYFIFMIYNYIVIFLLIGAIANLKFKI
jgi:hypothetical protein